MHQDLGRLPEIYRRKLFGLSRMTFSDLKKLRYWTKCVALGFKYLKTSSRPICFFSELKTLNCERKIVLENFS